MSITLYSKYRRQQLRNAWSFAGMSEWCQNVGLWILGFIAALALVTYIEDALERAEQAERSAKHHQHKSDHLENVILSCLNGRGVWLDDRLNLCNVADTHLTKSHFLTE